MALPTSPALPVGEIFKYTYRASLVSVTEEVSSVTEENSALEKSLNGKFIIMFIPFILPKSFCFFHAGVVFHSAQVIVGHVFIFCQTNFFCPWRFEAEQSST